MMRQFFSAAGDNLGVFDDESAALLPADVIEWPDIVSGLDRLNVETMTIIPFVENPPLDQRIAAAFGQLPAEIQAKYADEVTKAAIFYQWQNWTMLSVVIAQAEAKLSLPDEQAVKDILDAAKAELGG